MEKMYKEVAQFSVSFRKFATETKKNPRSAEMPPEQYCSLLSSEYSQKALPLRAKLYVSIRVT
jgi:hypothetical protein